jgi:NDP-sugar pyrophosphorylase family protein
MSTVDDFRAWLSDGDGDLNAALNVDRRRAREEGSTPRVVILAGGRGTRLAPYTSVLPKPLMPVGDRAILEIVLAQLAAHRLTDVTLCVGYLSHLIRAVLDDGARHGVDLRYVNENEPVGTAGPLRLVEGLDETFVAMNGDILTTLDFRDLVATHHASGNVLTIATHVRETRIDYGVLQMDGTMPSGARRVVGYEEKPALYMPVSMGIYVVEPRALEYIPIGTPFDFPSLVERLLKANEPVGAYPFDGAWLDIGRHEDYEEANRLWETEAELYIAL